MFQRQVESVNEAFLRYSLIGPKGAVSLSVIHLTYDNSLQVTMFVHQPCFDRECDNDYHGSCDLLGGECGCHCFERYLGEELTTLDDDPIFEMLTALYEVNLGSPYAHQEVS